MKKSIFERIQHKIKKAYYRPSRKVAECTGLLRLGSSYGGWTFADTPELQDSTVISCGLGEDASFDIEFAARYNAKVVIIDPTPRAITHFQKIQTRFGRRASRDYVKGGNQPIESYDLSKLNADNFQLIERAVWVYSGETKFFSDPVPEHVSHSIVNLQNQYAQDTDYITVPCITVDDLMKEIGLETLPLMKMDIEGAEIMVLPDMIKKGIRPSQLLIEFDELNVPSARSRRNFDATDEVLRGVGFKMCHFDGSSNFLYMADSDPY